MLDALEETARLNASARDTNGSVMSAQFTWSSSDTSIATVDANGLVTAQANGVATIIAASGGFSDAATVTVEQRVSSISVSPDGLTFVALGDTAQLEAAAQDPNGNGMSAAFRWTTSDSSVVAVDTGGVVTGRANGTATITATSEGASASATITVEQQVASVSVSPDSLTFSDFGNAAPLEAAAQDANGNAMSAPFTWTSSDTSIASVDVHGLVTARADGLATITAASGGFSATVNIIVNTRISISPAIVTFRALGDTAMLLAETRDADGMTIAAEFDWVSSAPAIATVDAGGLVTAKGNGTATITVSTGDLSASATVNVNQEPVFANVQPRSGLEPLRFDSIGETVQFTVVVEDSNGHPILGAVITPKSSNPDVVVIDANLLATATGNGRAAVSFDRLLQGVVNVRVHQLAARMQTTPSTRTFRRVNETHPFIANAWDANGHPVPEEFFTWESADQRVAVLDDTGLVRIQGNGTTAIALRSDESSVSAVAIVSGELEVACTAGPRTPSITAVEPESLVEGASVVIEGAGFCAEASGNLVTIDGSVASVVAASETMLQVTVPRYCRPARSVELTVAVGANVATRSMGLRAEEATLSLRVGQQVIIGGGAQKCLQFAEADDSDSYLIGVQSTTLLSEADGLTDVRLIATTDARNTQFDRATFNGLALWGPSESQLRAASDIVTPAWEQRQPPDVRSYSGETAPSFRSSRALDTVTFPPDGDIEMLPEVGDVVTIPGSADEWLVHAIGSYGLWLIKRDEKELIETAYAGLIEKLSEDFDTKVYPIVTDYFGAPELGNIGRLVMTVPAVGPYAAYYLPGDRKWQRIEVPLSRTFGYGDRNPPKLGTLAHELTHAIQYSVWRRRLFPDLRWLVEGQATLGTEIFVLATLGLSPGQNYGREVTWDRSNEIFRLADALNFTKISFFFGGPSPRTPQECSWLVFDDDRDRACTFKHYYYELGWLFLRWLTDQYGRMHPGGERHFHQELIQSGNQRVEAIERLQGETMETLLARWAAALYVDDRLADADPTLQFTTWNLWNLYSHIDGVQNPAIGLFPPELPFAELQRRARIRTGSTWYLRVSGEQRPATAFRVRDRAYGPLPDDMQIWVVRLE